MSYLGLTLEVQNQYSRFLIRVFQTYHLFVITWQIILVVPCALSVAAILLFLSSGVLSFVLSLSKSLNFSISLLISATFSCLFPFPRTNFFRPIPTEPLKVSKEISPIER